MADSNITIQEYHTAEAVGPDSSLQGAKDRVEKASGKTALSFRHYGDNLCQAAVPTDYLADDADGVTRIIDVLALNTDEYLKKGGSMDCPPSFAEHYGKVFGWFNVLYASGITTPRSYTELLAVQRTCYSEAHFYDPVWLMVYDIQCLAMQWAGFDVIMGGTPWTHYFTTIASNFGGVSQVGRIARSYTVSDREQGTFAYDSIADTITQICYKLNAATEYREDLLCTLKDIAALAEVASGDAAWEMVYNTETRLLCVACGDSNPNSAKAFPTSVTVDVDNAKLIIPSSAPFASYPKWKQDIVSQALYRRWIFCCYTTSTGWANVSVKDVGNFLVECNNQIYQKDPTSTFWLEHGTGDTTNLTTPGASNILPTTSSPSTRPPVNVVDLPGGEIGTSGPTDGDEFDDTNRPVETYPKPDDKIVKVEWRPDYSAITSTIGPVKVLNGHETIVPFPKPLDEGHTVVDGRPPLYNPWQWADYADTNRLEILTSVSAACNEGKYLDASEMAFDDYKPEIGQLEIIQNADENMPRWNRDDATTAMEEYRKALVKVARAFISPLPSAAGITWSDKILTIDGSTYLYLRDEENYEAMYNTSVVGYATRSFKTVNMHVLQVTNRVVDSGPDVPFLPSLRGLYPVILGPEGELLEIIVEPDVLEQLHLDHPTWQVAYYTTTGGYDADLAWEEYLRNADIATWALKLALRGDADPGVPNTRRFPWWILILLLCLVVLIIIIIVLNSDDDDEKKQEPLPQNSAPDSSASGASSSPQPESTGQPAVPTTPSEERGGIANNAPSSL